MITNSLTSKLGFSSTFENVGYVPVIGMGTSLATIFTSVRDFNQEMESKKLNKKELSYLTAYNIVNILSLGALGACFGIAKLVSSVYDRFTTRNKLSAAATTIQALARGFTTRNKLTEKKMAAAATTIQTLARGFTTRNKLTEKKMAAAATTIQTLARGFTTRNKLSAAAIKKTDLRTAKKSVIRALLLSKKPLAESGIAAYRSSEIAKLVLPRFPELLGCFSETIKDSSNKK